MQSISVFAVEEGRLEEVVQRNSFHDILRQAGLPQVGIRPVRDIPASDRDALSSTYALTYCSTANPPCLVASTAWLAIEDEGEILRQLLDGCVMADMHSRGESYYTHNHFPDPVPHSASRAVMFLWYCPIYVRSVAVALKVLPLIEREWLSRNFINDQRALDDASQGYWMHEAYRLIPEKDRAVALLDTLYPVVWYGWLLAEADELELSLQARLKLHIRQFQQVRSSLCVALLTNTAVREAIQATEKSRTSRAYYRALVQLLQLLFPTLKITRRNQS